MGMTYIYPPVSVQTSSAPIEFVQDGSSEQVNYDTANAANTKPLPSGMFFLKDGVYLPVAKDTGTPSNTNPVPVELVGAAGPINITAGDLNVQLTDLGANFDRTRIGNGTYQWEMNATGEGLVKDTDLFNKLQTFSSENMTNLLTANAHLSEIEGAVETLETIVVADGTAQPANGLIVGGHNGSGVFRHIRVSNAGVVHVEQTAQPLPTGAATETTLNNLLTAFNAEDFATASKQDAQTAHLANIASEDFATSAKQDAMITSLSSIAAEDFATETTLAAMSAKLPASLGQKTMANSMAVVLPSDQTVPTQNIAKVASYVQSLTIDGTTQQTFNAPANAKWCKVSAGIDNTVDLMVNFGAVATSTVGMEFQAGRSEDFDAVANISVIAKSAITNQKVSIFWGV